jgi:hypothetical protein
VLEGRHGTFQLVEAISFSAPHAALLVQLMMGFQLQHQKRVTHANYRRLFALAPSAQGHFSGNMESQGQKLCLMTQFLVHAMSRPEFIALGLRNLGHRHAR